MEDGPEPFDFSLLPHNLQQGVIEKFEFRDFAAFQQCSCSSLKISKSLPIRLECVIHFIHFRQNGLFLSASFGDDEATIPFHFCDYFPVKIHADSLILDCSLNDERCEILNGYLHRLKAEILLLHINCPISCDPQLFETFLSRNPFISFYSSAFLEYQYFSLPGMRSLSEIRSGGCHCRNEDLLLLKADRIEIDGSQLTESGLNSFLMQWKRGRRELWKASFTFPNPLDFTRVLLNLDANVLWTPEDHKDSVISRFPLESLIEFSAFPPRVYVLWRSIDIDERLILRYHENKVEIFHSSDPVDAITDLLSDAHYILFTGTCPLCYVDDCRHTREALRL